MSPSHMSATSSLIPNLFLHFPHSKICDQHFIFLWTFNSLILSKLLSHMIIKTTLVEAPISAFITRKTYCYTCSLSMWPFKTPLSMNPFPHLIHGSRPIAYVHSSYDYSIYTPLKVCSTSVATKFYPDIDDDFRRRLM